MTTVTPVALTPPNVSVAPETKFVPVMVTKVPPPANPDEGLMEVIFGTGPTVGVSVGVAVDAAVVGVGVRVALDVAVGVKLRVAVTVGVNVLVNVDDGV